MKSGSDHCPAMKGIETFHSDMASNCFARSDHCPAMKGIETGHRSKEKSVGRTEATTAPQ